MLINNTQFDCTCEEVISELRQQLRANGIRLLEKDPKQSGDNIQIQCPYHKGGQERRLSAGVKKDTGVFHCFGCGETHQLPELISYCFGHTDDVMGSFGWQWLVKNYLSISIEERKPIKLNLDRNSAHSKTEENYVSEEELDSYRYIHPYLEQRGIVDEDIIELFDLGYDRNTHSITFPIRNVEGRCLFIARRSVRSKFFNYPEGVEKPLYGLYELHKCIPGRERILKSEYVNPNEVWVCESMIDCILLWQSHKLAVAMNGLGNKLALQQLQDLPVRALVLATDNDEAGLNARDRIKSIIKNKIIYEAILPRNRKDIGECTPEEIQNIKVVL